MHLKITIEEMEYRPEDKSLLILAVDQFREIVTLEVKPVFPRQLAADLDFVSRHPHARVLLDGASPSSSPASSSGGDQVSVPSAPTDREA